MNQQPKKNNTIGCCGIDCGLCPRYISKSKSACPGCGAADFFSKHPSCGFLTCCAKNHGLEVCSECDDFPCKRFDTEKQGFDSFVTHRKVFHNHELIRKIGLNQFLIEQKQRIDILDYLMDNFDAGRSKSFFCQTCTLLPIENLTEIYRESKVIDHSLGITDKNRVIKGLILKISDGLEIDLKLRRKS